MLALALDDFTLLVVDIETRRVVRMFAGHHGNINDMVSCFQHFSNMALTSLPVKRPFLFLSDFQPRWSLVDHRWNGLHHSYLGPPLWLVR